MSAHGPQPTSNSNLTYGEPSNLHKCVLAYGRRIIWLDIFGKARSTIVHMVGKMSRKRYDTRQWIE